MGAAYLQEQGVPVTLLHYAESGQEPCIDAFIENRKLEMVLMFSNQFSERTVSNYEIRRLAVDYSVPLITNVQVATLFAESLEAVGMKAHADGAEAAPLTLDPRSVNEGTTRGRDTTEPRQIVNGPQ